MNTWGGGDLKIALTREGGCDKNDAQRPKSRTGGVGVMRQLWVSNSGGAGSSTVSSGGGGAAEPITREKNTARDGKDEDGQEQRLPNQKQTGGGR